MSYTRTLIADPVTASSPSRELANAPDGSRTDAGPPSLDALMTRWVLGLCDLRERAELLRVGLSAMLLTKDALSWQHTREGRTAISSRDERSQRDPAFLHLLHRTPLSLLSAK
mmetsp:Transcript_63/g.232  ORF Transcript_63/g.232 Transcript_63/m.232 type:complete len:113 (+) Transcript_63:1850-2188(+)